MIRRAKSSDITDINKLLFQVNAVHSDGRPDLFRKGAKKYNDEQLAAIIEDDNKPVFVCVDDNDRVLGYAFCIFKQALDDNVLTDIKSLYIDDLCVDEEARGNHIGTKIYNYVVDFARQSGCYNLTLNVWACNPSARAFYDRQGLKEKRTELETIL